MPSLANYGSAIAATTAALQQLIASVTPQVTARTLDAARSGIGGPSINVFLYRDELLVYREGSGPTRLSHIIAELQYLVSALPGDEADVDAMSQRAYGAARAAVQRNPVISASVGADGPMEVRLTTTALSLGDVVSLWTASDVPFRLSFGVTATFALTADEGPSALAGVAEVLTRARPGLIVVFSGTDTKAKTEAVTTVAEGIGLPLLEIALDQVVSKYIEETEKNLRRVFDAAEDGGAVLFFHEADALFGRRSEVRDSHDRYANLETGQVLDLLALAPGPVIIGLLDEPNDELLRRLAVEVRFPPDQP